MMYHMNDSAKKMVSIITGFRTSIFPFSITSCFRHSLLSVTGTIRGGKSRKKEGRLERKKGCKERKKEKEDREERGGERKLY